MTHTLDVFSDIACPWCFIGKRRLATALAKLPTDERPTIKWHAYQLMPEFPEGQARPSRAFLEQRFGGPARFAAMFERVRTLAAAEGIAFDVDAQQAVNTKLAHRGVAIAAARGHEDAAVDAMFSAHFEQGKNLADVDVVAGIVAGVCGVDVNVVRAEFVDGAGADVVDADLKDGRLIGVTGVPFFVLNGQLAMSGAQEPETFVEFIREGAKRAG
jgi:predicted DsbA family dithiol-disulfide isomerase